jgi:hypothetical protein
VSNEPLGLPAGSIRAVMTLILVLAVCALCVMGHPVPEILQQGFLVALGMYHLSRNGSHVIAVPTLDGDK